MNKLKIMFKNFFTRFNNQNHEDNSAVKKGQSRNLWLVVSGITGITILTILIQHHHQSPPDEIQNKHNKSTSVSVHFTDPMSHIDQQSIWIEKEENRLEQQMQMQASLKASQKTNTDQLQKQQDFEKNQQQQLQQLMGTVNHLKNELEQQKSIQTPSNTSLPNSQMISGPELQDDPVNLIPLNNTVSIDEKTPDTYVPPGAFVTAAVLQGVDAGAGVTSQSDPRPVLLRTITDGILPGNFHSHLKNCLLVGSGYADASSERVYVRLETMSCTRDGKEVDYPVYGYISGTDAKTGQHGPVVFRDGPFVERAFWGGFLSGLGNMGQQYSQSYNSTPFGTVTSIDPKQIPLAAASSGFGSAAQMYAQYNIRRAEQYQPVVEFSAGKIVDIVFTKGFYLDGHMSDPNLITTRSNTDIQNVNSDLPMQINALSQNPNTNTSASTNH